MTGYGLKAEATALRAGDEDADIVVSIVNTSNRDLLLACLRSLTQGPSGQHSIKVVVLDNASEDGSADAVRDAFPQVGVIEQRHRDGFSANHNAVIAATESPFVFVLNEDTEVSPTVVSTLAAYLEDHPSVAAVGPKILGPDGSQQGSAWSLPTVGRAARWALTLGLRGGIVSTGSVTKPVDAVSACAVMLRREHLDACGGLDDGYFIFGEEAELAQRLRRLGLETHYIPTQSVLHHGQQTTSRNPARQVTETWRSNYRYFKRWHGQRETRAITTLFALGYGLALAAFALGHALPGRIRPSVIGRTSRQYLWLNARAALLGPTGPGIRESAEEWNRANATDCRS